MHSRARRGARIWFLAGAALILVFGSVRGQETPLMKSATQPSRGTFLLKSQARGYHGSTATANQLSLPFSISTGVARGHSLALDGGGNFSRTGSGLSDATISWKWRFHSSDHGVISTSRTALMIGLQVPSGCGGWGTGSFNPSLGIAHTSIIGRLGIGAAIEYKFNTGHGAKYDLTGMDSSHDAISLGIASMWRVHPKSYAGTSGGALYLGVEGEVVQGGAGSSARIGPSLMYEAETWVFECGYQFYPLNSGDMEPVQGMAFTGFRFFF